MRAGVVVSQHRYRPPSRFDFESFRRALAGSPLVASKRLTGRQLDSATALPQRAQACFYSVLLSAAANADSVPGFERVPHKVLPTAERFATERITLLTSIRRVSSVGRALDL